MLLEEFDKAKTAVLNPEQFVPKIEGFPEVCLCLFSKRLMRSFVRNFKPKKIAYHENSTAIFNIYEVDLDGVKVAVTHLPVGASASAGSVEMVIRSGAKKILAVGSAGCLSTDIEEYGIVVPTSAIRDEGTSYHYLPAADEVKIDKDMTDAVCRFLRSVKVAYTTGKTWTTDAIMRETKAKVERRKAQGAVTVEMECSALAAVCRFRGVKFVQILYGADSLALDEYEVRSLVSKMNASKSKILVLALECARFLAENHA